MPESNNFRHRQIPLLFRTRHRKQLESLRIGIEDRKFQRIAHCFVHVRKRRCNGLQRHLLRLLHPKLLRARHNACVHARGYRGHRHAIGHGSIRRPFAGTLLGSRIFDDIQQVFLRHIIALREYLRRYFQQIGSKRWVVVPSRKSFADLCITGATGLQEMIGLGQELHQAVFNPVMDHLHKMPGSARPQIPNAAAAFTVLRRHLLQKRRQGVVRRFIAARHHARAMERSLFTAAHPEAEVLDAFCLERFRAAGGVTVVTIPTINDDIAL